MAESLSITTQVRTVGRYENSGGVGGAPQIIDNSWTWAFLKDDADTGADGYFRAEATLASTTVSWNLEDGTLLDIYSKPLALASVKELVIINRATTAGYSLAVSGDWFTTAFGITTSFTLPVGAGFIIPSNLLGLTVTATTADVLTLDSGSNSVPYTVELIGVKQ